MEETLRPRSREIKVELGVGALLPGDQEFKEVEVLMTTEEMMDACLRTLQKQVTSLNNKKKALTAAENRILNDAIKTLSSVQRKLNNEGDKSKKDEQAQKSADEISKLSKKQLIELVAPVLNDMGLRIVNDTLKPDKEIEDNEEDD
jgi:predicted metal-dependent hydrolase